ncbi:MAG: murein hydrolase activator EnvC family protein [Actinomycetota bacterium]
MPKPFPFPRTLAALALGLALLAAVLPRAARADTASDLARAKEQLEVLQGQLRRAVQAANVAESRLAETIHAIENAEVDIARLESESAEAAERLQERAILAFESGRSGSLESLLASGSISEFTDRIEFLGQLIKGDADLEILLLTNAERIRQRKDDLAALRAQQADNARDLEAKERDVRQRVESLQARVNDLATRYRQETTILGLLGQTLRPGAPIGRCPILGVNSFVDSFGWPRPGDRTHQGIDLIASSGTPIVAVADGYARSSWNSLGGNAVFVESSGGDYTYYAHLSGYGTLGWVSAGTIIGYVGATGDASGPHLHFEYHPGGGSAINAYSALVVVC